MGTLAQDAEENHTGGRWIREFILGGQDGLVNVLGLILGVATATQDTRYILIAGISALFAESISMGAVAYTSSKASRDFYRSMLAQEEHEIKYIPKKEKQEIYNIYYKKGFRGRLLKGIVDKITADKKLWVETMMVEELKLMPDQSEHPGKVGWIVLASTTVGSFIPLLPYLFLPVYLGTITSIILSTVTLFAIGVVKAKVTIGGWKRSGIELAAIGILAAIAGFSIGKALEIIFLTA